MGKQRTNTVARLLADVHRQLSPLADGHPADYIPELALVSPDQFGITLATTDGFRHQVGDYDVGFTIQSVSKAFVYGLVIDAVGLDAVDASVDLEPSGDAFNEISLDPVTSKPMNAMINAGAIAITGLVPGDSAEARFQWLHDGLSALAGRTLGFDQNVYRSEADTGHRNRAIAYLLRNGGILGDRVDADVDLYFRQCSIVVTCQDLACMGATLAHGGVNPLTRERVLSEQSVERVLSVMSSSGMYDWSGSWITMVGLPAKSGVGGGVVAVLPGQLAISVFSPRLDEQGNSVRGIATCRELSRRFNLHLFNAPTVADHVVRRTYRLASEGSIRQWPVADLEAMSEAAGRVCVVELRGDLFFTAVERLIRCAEAEQDVQTLVFDCGRVGLADRESEELLVEAARDLAARGIDVHVVDPKGMLASAGQNVESLTLWAELDPALESIEISLLTSLGRPTDGRSVALENCELFGGLDAAASEPIRSMMQRKTFASGDVVCRRSEPSEDLFVLESGSVDIVGAGPGPEHVVRIASLPPGSIVGDIAVIEGVARTADVIATADTVAWSLSAAALDRIEREYSGLHSTLLRNILLLNFKRLRARDQSNTALL